MENRLYLYNLGIKTFGGFATLGGVIQALQLFTQPDLDIKSILLSFPMQHIYIIDYQRPFILIGTTSVLTNTQNVGTNANRCISWYCIYVLYRLFSVLLWNVRYQIQCIE